MSKDRCEYCEGELIKRKLRTKFHFKGETIYIDNVPAWVCNRCGEHYYDASVYKRMEEIAKNREQISKTICFPLADYVDGVEVRDE